MDTSWAICDASTQATLPKPGRHDCLCGCVLTGDLVCGANGLTYDSECLATCSGTTVSHKGGCVVWIRGGAPPPDPHAGRGGSAASAPPLETVIEGLGPRPTRQYHALAGMLDTSAAAGPAFAAPRVEAVVSDDAGGLTTRRSVSAAAIKAYEADGFALVGAGRGPGAPEPAKGTAAKTAGAGAGAGGGIAGVAVPVADDHLRTVRYVVKSGLLYASVAPVAIDHGKAGAGGAAPPRLVQPAHVGSGMEVEAAPAAAGDDESPPHLISGPGMGAPAPAPRPAKTGFTPSQWKQTTKAPTLPMRTATLLTKRKARAAVAGSADDEPAPGPPSAAALADTASCSGVLIGRYVVGTAGRCLYDRATRKFASPLTARPGAFRGAGGAFTAPAGMFDAVLYSVMAGFGEAGNSTFFPDAFDVGAVITDGGPTRIIGDLVGGWMGFISDMAAFGTGRGVSPEPEAPEAAPKQGAASLFLWAAGYPAITQSLGSLWQWAAACAPRGGWGGVGRSAGGAVLDLPTAACPGGEGGLMGAPLFDTENYVRGFFTGFGNVIPGGGGGVGGVGGGIIDNFLAVTPTLFEFMKKSMALTPPPPGADNP